MVIHRTDRTPNIRTMHCLRAPLGGLFRHVCDLIHCQTRQGLAVGIICDISTGDDVANRMLKRLEPACDLGAHRVAIDRLISPRDALTYRRISVICAQHKPDIIHGHGAKGGAFARLLAPALDAAAVYTPHGGSLHYRSNSPTGRFYLLIERYLRPRTSGMIFESEYARHAYIEKVGPPPAPSRLIVNGLRSAEFATLTEDSVTHDFVFVGELRDLKGPQIMVDALSRLERPWRALIIGSGPTRGELDRKIRSLGLDSKITLAPPVYPGVDAFAQGACVVVPSLAESLPYIVLEAAAAGRPLIATDVGGIPEIFGPLAAQLLPAGDAAALTGAMNDFLDHRERARARAIELQQHVREHFQVDQMVSATTDLYREVVAGRA